MTLEFTSDQVSTLKLALLSIQARANIEVREILEHIDECGVRDAMPHPNTLVRLGQTQARSLECELILKSIRLQIAAQ